MKKVIIIITALFLISFMAFSQEIEPNDTPEQANPILLGETMSGTISTTDLADFYRLELSEGGLIELGIQQQTPGGNNFVVAIIDGEDMDFPDIQIKTLTWGTSQSTMWQKLLKGTYYIQLRSAAGPVSYQITPILHQPAWPEDIENNNGADSAIMVQIGDTLSGTLQYYGAGEGEDVQDWYRIDLEEAGYVELYVQQKLPQGNWFNVHIHDGELDSIPSIKIIGLSWGTSETTQGLHLLKGTYYIRVADALGPIDYRIVTRLVPAQWPTDIEPNNEADSALTVYVGDTLSGTLKYYEAGVGEDVQDWYRLELEEPGYTEFFIQQKLPQGNWFNVHIHDGELDSIPSIKIIGLSWGTSETTQGLHLLKGTYYIRVADAGGPIDYRIVTRLVPVVWPTDMEPNNDTTTALLMPLNDTLTGNVYYYDVGEGLDERDWYQIDIPHEGRLILDIYKQDNGASLWTGLREVSQSTIIAEAYFEHGHTHKQIKENLLPGSYSFWLAGVDKGVAYQIQNSYVAKATAAFEYMQVNQTYAFENNSQFGQTYLWEFGDGNMSEAVDPLHVYELPNVYDVCLTTSNELYQDTYCEELQVPGLARIFPTSGGNVGSVTVNSFGGALDTFHIMSLSQNGTDIVSAELTFETSRNSISSRLNLDAVPTGTYDVILSKPGEAEYMIEDGFEVIEGIKADPWVRVLGRDRFLFNTWTTYTVEMGNNGNVDASVVPIWLLFEETENFELEYVDPKIFVEDTLDTSLGPNEDYVVIDTTDGAPYKLRAYSMFIPSIPHGENISFDIRVKSNEDVRIISYAEKPYFQSPINSKKVDCKSEKMVEAASERGEEVEKICTISQLSRVLSIFLLRSVEKGLGRSLFQLPKVLRIVFKQCGIDDPELRNEITLVMVVSLLQTHNFGGEENPPIQADVAFDVCEPEFEPQNMSSNEIHAVASVDPNEKTGPTGFEVENYFKNITNVPYRIYFENKDSATAPAHIVRVSDQLDTEKFNLSAFSFGNIAIGDSLLTPEPGLKEYLADLHLPEYEVVVRVYAKMDDSTGEVEWLFRSLDPITLLDIEDPDVGFLPPNLLPPQGEGYVSFDVRSEDGLNHQDEILNGSVIYFDANPPIVTNDHLMTIDLVAPESEVSALPVEIDSNLFEISWSGKDDEAGIAYYDIYFAGANDTFAIWRYHTPFTSSVFTAPYGNEYRFYSVATDWVSNREEAPATHDAEISVILGAEDLTLEKDLLLYPNPANDRLNLEFSIDQKLSSMISVTDAYGVLRETIFAGDLSPGQHHFEINTMSLPDGIYFINIGLEGRALSKRFVLLR